MDQLFRQITERRSYRGEFDSEKKIPHEDMEKILEAARWAPTPHNMQNFEIVVVEDEKILGRISKVERPVSEEFVRENYQFLSFSKEELEDRKIGILGNSFPEEWIDPARWGALFSGKASFPLGRQISNSSALMIVLYDPSKRAPASEGDFLGILSLGCVMENVWLIAGSLGIGVQIISALSDENAEEEVRKILKIPKNFRIAFSVRLGYPVGDSKGAPEIRREKKDFVHYDGF